LTFYLTNAIIHPYPALGARGNEEMKEPKLSHLQQKSTGVQLLPVTEQLLVDVATDVIAAHLHFDNEYTSEALSLCAEARPDFDGMTFSEFLAWWYGYSQEQEDAARALFAPVNLGGGK
jgi:hypothetical protein